MSGQIAPPSEPSQLTQHASMILRCSLNATRTASDFHGAPQAWRAANAAATLCSYRQRSRCLIEAMEVKHSEQTARIASLRSHSPVAQKVMEPHRSVKRPVTRDRLIPRSRFPKDLAAVHSKHARGSVKSATCPRPSPSPDGLSAADSPRYCCTEPHFPYKILASYLRTTACKPLRFGDLIRAM
eukprot:2580000-Amphidinium_carterae.1